MAVGETRHGEGSMSFFQFKSIQHRLIVLLLLPMTVMLLLSGITGYLFSRNIIFKHWESSAISKVERAAHSVDMRLSRIIEWMEMFHQTGQIDARRPSQQWIIQYLESLEGVTRAQIVLNKESVDQDDAMRGPSMHLHGNRRLHFHRGHIIKLTSPALNTQQGLETVSIFSSLVDTSDQEIGQLRVEVRFDFLMQDILKYGWWQSERAFLIDNSGRFVLHTARYGEKKQGFREVSDPFELQLLEQIRSKPFGTLYDSGQPPKQVAGYHTIETAQWSVVLVAPGTELLAPIVKFRNYFLVGVLGLAFVIVMLTRYHLRQIVTPVQALTAAAKAVAEEDYETHIEPRTNDEIGQLARGFNAMVEGLRERAYIRNTFGRYVDHEIARQLLMHPEAARLGGDKRHVAILMADIRSFTPLAESISPEDTVALLNLFFSSMIRVANQFRGIIVDFLGDGLLVFFDSAGMNGITAAQSAVGCGLQMQDQMNRLRPETLPEHIPTVKMGVGINFGEVIVGNIGSEERAKYGIVGSAVNATQRIQSLAEGGQVVISESTRRLLGDRVDIASQFSKIPKGYNQPLTLYVVKACRCDIES